MEELSSGGETFEIDEPKFQCVVCENLIQFKFEPEESQTTEELPEEFEEEISTPENFEEEVEEEFEKDADEEQMKIDCDCGAEYVIKKIPGIPGFEVVHLIESEPELVEKEFEEEF